MRLKNATGEVIAGEIKSATIRKYSAQDDYTVGSAFSASAEILIETDVDLRNKTIILEIGLKLPLGTIEYIPDGKYTITTVKKVGNYILATGYDAMYVKGTAKCPAPTLPITLVGAFEHVASCLGVSCEGITSPKDTTIDVQLSVWPDATCLQMAGYLAGLCLANAYISREGALTAKRCEQYDYILKAYQVNEAEITPEARIVSQIVMNSESTENKNNFIRVNNPLMTPERQQALNQHVIAGYHSASVTIPLGNPCLDPWDIIFYQDKTVGNYSPFCCHNLVTHFDGGLYQDIESYALTETEETTTLSEQLQIETNQKVVENLYSEWKTLALNEGFVHHGNYGRSELVYRVAGKHVWISGAVVKTEPFGTTFVAVSTLPEEIRPAHNQYHIACVGGTGRYARVVASAGGNLGIDWVYDSNGRNTTSAGLWVDCTIDYFLD